MASSPGYLQAFRDAATRMLPAWMHQAIHSAAFHSAGGAASHGPKLDTLSNGGTIPDQEIPPEGLLDVADPPAADPPTAAVTPAVKDGPTSGQSHVNAGLAIDQRYQPGMPGPGGTPQVRKALTLDLGAEEAGGVEVVVKRAYEAPGCDGIRVLVDRGWPRAITKAYGRYAMHLPAVAPSAGLGEWQQANPGDWDGFERRYRAELAREPARTAVEKLADLAGRTHVTLVTAAPDRERNAATVLKAVMAGEPDDEPVEFGKDDTPHIGLSDEVKSAFLAQARKDPPVKIASAMRRLSEWASSGHYPTGLNHGDLKWMYDQYAKILHHRNPDSGAGGNFPASGAARKAMTVEYITKCPSLTRTLARVREEAAAKEKAAKAEWSTAYVDTLPDSSFAWIQPGGKKDDTGRTIPRSLRHLPWKEENGTPDLPHVRDALSHIGQVHGMPAEAKNGIRQHFEALLARTGVGKSDVVSFVKADAQRQVVHGVVLQPDELDTQDDKITEDEIEKSAHRFLQHARHVGLQHNGVTHRAAVVESFCAPQDLTYPGIDGTPQQVKKGSWVMAIHVPDPDLWADVQAGKYTGFSPGGWGEREPA